MNENILHVIQHAAFAIGLIGITIIAIGAVRGLYHYLLHLRDENFTNIRHELGSHLILGLDFLVAKDIIDTLLIDATGDSQLFWRELALLMTVVAIRIIMTHFIQRELNDTKHKPKKKGWFR